MNWFYFEYKYPFTFGNFCRWYEANYKEEYAACRAPVFDEDRLLEYFNGRAFDIEISQDVSTGHFHLKISGKFMAAFSTRAGALQMAMHNIFQKAEKKVKIQAEKN